ncbi:MAG: hypothetical protein ABEJ68_03490 [Halobacteriaceae archaeon]
MSRTVPVLIVVAAVVAAVVASPLAVAAGVGNGFAQTTDADTPSPGAQLAGVVGSEGAEIEGNLQERSFSVALSNASSPAAKAAVVASTHGSLSDRLTELRERKASLTARYENGSLSRGEYQARLARLGAQIRSLTQMANQTSDAARDLPAEALEAKGVNVSALTELRQNAANLSGPAVAAAARNLTNGGPPAGVGPNGTPGAGTAGPPKGNETARPGQSGNANDRTAGRRANVTTGADGAPGASETGPAANRTETGTTTPAGNANGAGDAPAANGASPGGDGAPAKAPAPDAGGASRSDDPSQDGATAGTPTGGASDGTSESTVTATAGRERGQQGASASANETGTTSPANGTTARANATVV